MLKEGYSSNKQKIEGCLLASFNKFYCKKCQLVFCLNTGKRFFLEVLFWGNQKGRGYQVFLKYLPFTRLSYFYVTITRDFERFQYFHFTKPTCQKPILIHSFPVHPLSTPWKSCGFLMFSGDRERVHWERLS